jgi:ribosomal protein S18 acetylase RimI-like enzyme
LGYKLDSIFRVPISMNDGRDNMIRVRAYRHDDREFVLSLAPRLIVGMPAWRDPHKCLSAVQGWITTSVEQHGEKTMFFVAEDERRERLGFATVSSSSHFTGETQAYIGELATSEEAEGRGVGKALVQSCEQWARDQGYRIITLDTGAANERAIAFYHHLDYQDEDIKLIKLLD